MEKIIAYKNRIWLLRIVALDRALALAVSAVILVLFRDLYSLLRFEESWLLAAATCLPLYLYLSYVLKELTAIKEENDRFAQKLTNIRKKVKETKEAYYQL